MHQRSATIAGLLLALIHVPLARADEPVATPPATATATPPAATAPATATPPAATAPATVTPPAPQKTDDATRAAARQVAEQGLQLFDSGQYAKALDCFERAGALVKAPTMALMAARSLEKLGRLVEASERYLAATRIQLDDAASDAFRAAQTDAAKEREALQPRIPSLTITVGNAPGGAAISLDGKPLAAALLGVAMPIDPGAHTVTIAGDGQSKDEPFTLKEGDKKRLVLSLEAAAKGSPLRTAGWVGLAVGGAGLVAGAVAGGVLLSTKSQLDGAGCKDQKCPSATAGDVDTYNTLRPVTTGALAVGAALAVAGGLVLILTPSSPGAASGNRTGSAAGNRFHAEVQPFIGFGSAGVKGVF